jgi:hypothetical protein
MVKPENWNSMSRDEKLAFVQEFIRSPRGHFVLRTALDVAIREMNKAEFPAQSDIEDLETIFEVMGGSLTFTVPERPPAAR